MPNFTRPTDVFRVMTLNTWFRPPLEGRMREMAAWLDDVQPHVVCLQEVRRAVSQATLADELAELCSGTWNVAYEGHPDTEGLLSGNAMISRWPFESTASHRLEGAEARPKSLLSTRTAGIDVFCVHLSSDPAGAVLRENQVVFVDEAIASHRVESSPLPPVLAGDFNAAPGSSAIRFLRGELGLGGRGTFYQDAWGVAGTGPGVTWDHRNPHTPPAYLFDARCDYVFVGAPKVPLGWSGGGNPDVAPDGQVVAAYLACNTALTGTYASDHYAVVADIRWSNVAEF